MMNYRRNSFRADMINRFGETTGLPLFEKKNEEVPTHLQRQFENAPKSIPVATDTRKLSLMTLKIDELKLSEKQQKVFECIALIGPASNEEIAAVLDWPINRVVGRTFELRQIGLVEADGKRQCRITDMVVTTWRVKDTKYFIEG